jgi:hypothetical protein
VAEQHRNPLPWDDSMSDGCTGVHGWLGTNKHCVTHDRRYASGGSVEDKLRADDTHYSDLRNENWYTKYVIAKRRYWGIRMFTYNYPPGHPMRKNYPGRVEAFNWLGPGPREGDY